MRKLESMIAQFVDDLLHTIGEATIEELRELFAPRPEGEKLFATNATKEGAAPALSPNRPVDAVPLRVPTRVPVPAPARATARAAQADHGGAARRRSIALYTSASSASAPPPPGVAEITDPASLLLLGTQSLPSLLQTPRSSPLPPVLESIPGRGADNHAEPEGESPASHIRPTANASNGVTVRLSDNETFARVSNSGVVIRRKKRA